MDELRGQGNGSESRTYNFLDRDMQSGQVYFYRLADVSTSGLMNHHKVITVQAKMAIPDFKLLQNYPNPFNPLTTINYELPATNYVELSIYNLLGQKVATLVSENQKAGEHQVKWDASAFASGIYYSRIEAGVFQDVKKLILIR
jgi:hypothetical protein